MKFSLEPAKRINLSWSAKPSVPPRPSYPDAFASDPVYRVTGRPANEAERCASEDLLKNTFSNVREVRLKLFPWPGRPNTDLLVAAQYAFRDANPAGSCWSIGLLVRLTKIGATWHRRESYLLETQHHTSIQRVELLNLDATALPQLVVESNLGGAATLGSTLQVFHLANGRFDEILNTQSRLEYDVEEAYTQELDIPATRATRFRLKKTTYLEKGTWFNPPRVSHVHFNRGAGVDKASQRLRQQMLTPLK
jgi:hypothetical protein